MAPFMRLLRLHTGHIILLIHAICATDNPVIKAYLVTHETSFFWVKGKLVNNSHSRSCVLRPLCVHQSFGPPLLGMRTWPTSLTPMSGRCTPRFCMAHDYV
ncbi:hypothetical protein VNO77_03841 [Canavalia gladiata]|uniref:Secreted protein n=1 Tax=Canavalia gladiata TaxID=3824 RepID=A0AAN9R8I3_CANGL